MAKVIMTIAPEDGMYFENICSFRTENYIGIWDGVKDDFMLVEKTNIEFAPWYLHKENKEYEDLQSLDNAVYDLCEEHIQEVFESNAYEFVLKTDD